MQQFNIQLDENWITPSALADELDIARSTVSGWIRRDQIDYVILSGAKMRRHLVDRRTAPALRPVGAPTKKKRISIAKKSK